VLLLDNPGLELHLDGQRDIKRFLEEKVSLDSQVVYVTHSPAMVDSFNLRATTYLAHMVW
jgi:predicted ATP-dependent endonuclease of OLD family